MNIYQPAYFISQADSWPNETFTITLSNQLIDPDLGFLPIINDAFLLKNPINSITNGFLPILPNKTIGINSLIDYSYFKSSVGLSDDGILQIDFNRDSSLQWATSALRRKYEVGPLFNMMQIDITPGADGDDKKYYGYLIFPPKLQLRPTSLSKTGSNWQLSTQTVVRSTSTFFTNFSTVDVLGYDLYKTYTRNRPLTQPLPSGYTLFYEICGTSTRVDRPIINFTDTHNPNYFSVLLEPQGSVIRPDSTSVSYSVEYYSRQEDDSNTIIELGQETPIYTNLQSPFRATYLLNYDPIKDRNKQYFQLIQRLPFTSPPLDTLRLSESGFCVLSGIFDLNISNFKYFNHNYFVRTGLTNTLVTTITGEAGTSLSVSYITERPRIFFTNETVQSTASIAGATTTFGTPIATSPGQTLTWTTKYPPHYYSYKALLSSEGFNPLSSMFMDVDNLTFYLYNHPISSTTTSVTLSTYIKSDFNFLSYDLFTHNYNTEYIRYKPLLTEGVILSALQCFYGANLNKPYSLFDSPWIPVSEGQNFIISYPDVDYGEISVVVTSTLSSVNGFLDAKEIEPLILAKGQQPRDRRPRMEIDLIEENDDYLIADASFITSETTYPFRNLTDSYVSWYFYPSSTYMRIDGVDQNGQYVTTIPPYSSVLFNEKTWTVRVSGYGPETTTVLLSSQKYNIVASVTSNSAYFDFFRDGKFVVGPSVQLNNLNRTRTITLTAAVPYKNRIYQLPSNVYIYWQWNYDGQENILNENIQASYINSVSSYFAGIEQPATQLSALNFKITPNYADAAPNNHKVEIYAISNYYNPNTLNSNTTPFFNLQGKYEFFVDDFPDPSIFNTDFLINYATGSRPLIANTRTGSLNNRTTVITRPISSTNSFSLTGNTDALPSLVVPSNGSIVWSVSDNVNGAFSSSSFPSGSNVFYNLNLISSPARKTIVTLSAVNCIVPGWISAHNVACDAVFYTIPATEFNTPLSFNLYPPYAWLGGQYLTLLNNNNYTLSLTPTAYANKISNSQNYYVSANLNYFSSYIYATNFGRILSNVNSASSEIDVPYTPVFYSSIGQQINLSAYNQEYPLHNGTTYIDHFGKIKTYPNNRSTTVPFYLSSTPAFQYTRNPRIVPYDGVILTFNLVNTAIDLDRNRFITVNQTISSPNAVQPIPNSSTVTYTISTEYWNTKVTVPATNGIRNLTLLNVGDPYYENFVSSTKNTNLYIKAEASILASIPSSTFDNYSTIQYPGVRALWSTATQIVSGNLGNPWSTIVSYNTGQRPEIFLSSYYTTTSNPILIQFYSPTPLTQDSSDIITDYSVFIADTTLSMPATGYLYYHPTKVGSFNISYSAYYLNNDVREYNLDIPLIVKAEWDEYNQEDIRILDEISLTLPYTQEQIEIQPNEWGDADIFNTALGRIYDNLEYLKLNSQTINTDSPTIYYGWLGCNTALLSQGIRWYTKTYGESYYNEPSLAALVVSRLGGFNLNNISYFSTIKGIAESKSHMFVLDGTLVRAFSASKIPVERSFSNMSEVSSLFITAQSLAIDNTGTVLYTVDSSKNQIFKFDLDLSYINPYINISNIVGSYGYRIDSNKFNTPTEIIYQNKNVYVLDYGNNCIKQYDENLNWLYTYYAEEFLINKPVNIAVHPSNLLYVLTNDYKIHIFDQSRDNIIQTIDLEQVRKTTNSTIQINNQNIIPIVKIIFDEPGEFLYIVTNSTVFKYTATGYFLSILNLPSNDISYTSANYTPNRGLIFSTSSAIIKAQDILEIFRVGKGLPTKYWTKEQILVGREEMAQDIVYNRALKRLAQNIKTFRNSLDSKFVITSELTDIGLTYYFTLKPIDESQRPTLNTDVENENLSVGVNELHIPQTLNKELIKLYNSLDNMTSFLNVKDIREEESNDPLCSEPFCWSWKATSCYSLKLPMIKVCNINPITYDELKSRFTVNYAPTKSWGLAVSNCCKDVEGPTIA